MIFVTVGVQLPFDRLIRTMDAWAGERARDDIEAQTGESTYVCQHIRARPYLDPPEFLRLVNNAELVVAHAGMGSIITALELGKPIIVMPRHASLMEHRNDHQLSTARHLAEHGHIRVARDADELVALLDRGPDEARSHRISADANVEFIASLKKIIDQEPRRSVLSRFLRVKPLDPGRAKASRNS